MSGKKSSRNQQGSRLQNRMPHAVPRLPGKINAEIEAKVAKEVDRLLPKPKPFWPFFIYEPAVNSWSNTDWESPTPVEQWDFDWRNSLRCSVCKCPDYRIRPLRRRGEPGCLMDPFLEPTHHWVCVHCEADGAMLAGPVMWNELVELRDSVAVEGITYEEFCEKELQLFDRYLSAEDIHFSDQMVALADRATFTVKYAGQSRSLRTGLLIRRFQIMMMRKHWGQAYLPWLS